MLKSEENEKGKIVFSVLSMRCRKKKYGGAGRRSPLYWL